MNKYLLASSLLIVTSCSHTEIIKKAHVPGTCAEKIKEIKTTPSQTLVDLSKQSTAGTLSIAITGVGATTDAVFIILTNPVTTFSICAGSFALAVNGNFNSGLDICQHLDEKTYNPKLTQAALDSTKTWRCPNLDYISEGLRNVASCYTERNEKDKAKLQLENILNDKTISPCISKKESLKVKDQIASL